MRPHTSVCKSIKKDSLGQFGEFSTHQHSRRLGVGGTQQEVPNDEHSTLQQLAPAQASTL